MSSEEQEEKILVSLKTKLVDAWHRLPPKARWWLALAFYQVLIAGGEALESMLRTGHLSLSMLGIACLGAFATFRHNNPPPVAEILHDLEEDFEK